jgi:hypothetical protein
MSFRLNRRRWVLLMGSTPLLAQTSAQAPATAAQQTEKAKAEVKQVSDKLAAIELPMNIEPSFRFMA